ncbi:DUF3826 domain-containing protein [Spirosoma sp. BT702]|uniref:DUF3826 domain-containing protein n=1 Tax=Spirosoma profusum TaxID=2771354 RepID=A0A927ASI2_9BACT|nr:DUF3826 domain-containing protein [Spirosoma profusum]MBD2703886.1 DUF3826 domain-containing protein [Spirosoma profusum]
MNRTLKNYLLGPLLLLIGTGLSFGQEQSNEGKEAAYTRVVNERAAKIVATLGITDATTTDKVQQLIAQQYRNLNDIHENRKSALANLTDKTEKETVEKEASTKLTALHNNFLTSLGQALNPQQIDQVKDGMTYGVVPITFKGYQAMLPDLTDAQKTQILAWLTEARERAMDEGTSKEKHAMFGKYKGRINNYLSAAGIDMKKASKEWEERIAREKSK